MHRMIEFSLRSIYGANQKQTVPDVRCRRSVSTMQEFNPMLNEDTEKGDRPIERCMDDKRRRVRTPRIIRNLVY